MMDPSEDMMVGTDVFETAFISMHAVTAAENDDICSDIKTVLHDRLDELHLSRQAFMSVSTLIVTTPAGSGTPPFLA